MRTRRSGRGTPPWDREWKDRQAVSEQSEPTPIGTAPELVRIVNVLSEIERHLGRIADALGSQKDGAA